jgi:TetR/AcrR family transcriptional regulator, cholesterol catabolism regulator
VAQRRKAQPKEQEGRSPVLPSEVLDAAAEMFLANGYFRTRMQDIASSFGVTHAALYYHFRNKTDILAQVNLRACQDLLARANSILAQNLDPADTFVALIRSHMTYVAENPALIATFFENDFELPAAQFRRIQRMRRQYTDVFLDVYEKGVDQGLLVSFNTNVAVFFALGACNWIYRWYEPGGTMGPAQLVDEGMRLIDALFRAKANGEANSLGLGKTTEGRLVGHEEPSPDSTSIS